MPKIIRKHYDDGDEIFLVEDDGSQHPMGYPPPDYRDGEQPLTMADRRKLITNVEVRRRREHEEFFRDYLSHGKAAVLDMPPDLRAQSESSASAGAVLVPAGFRDALMAAMKQVDGIFEAAAVVTTPDGGDYTMPLDDDSANNAAIVSQNTISNFVDAIFDAISFGKTPMFRSGFVRASMELAADAPNLETKLAQIFGRRFARAVGATHTTTLVAAATLGKTAASATAVTGDELLDLMGSLDSAHAQLGSWLMNFTVWTALRKLKGSTSGDYLLPIGRDPATNRPTLFDRPVYFSPSLANLTTTAKPILFGNLAYFIRREVDGGLQLKTFSERYAEFGQIGFEMYWRVDGALAKAANAPVPVKYLQMA